MFEKYNKYITKGQQLAAVKQDGTKIRYIYNPSEEIKLAAVKENEYAIEYINNPSEEVQLAAVKENEYAIEYINNPSEEVQLEAVKENRVVIAYIHNPSEKVVRYLIEKYYNSLKIMELLYAKVDFNTLPDDLKLLVELG